MKFDKILEYQRLDQEIASLDNLVASSDVARARREKKARIGDLETQIGKLTEEANSLMSSFNATQSRIEALKADLDEYDGIEDDIQDIAEADYLLKKVTAIANEIAALESEIAKLSKRLDEINAKYQATWAQGMKEAAEFKPILKAYNEYKAQIDPQKALLIQKRDALVAEIDPSLLTKYNNFKSGKNNRMPFIVPYDRSTTSCPRCFMTIENATLAQLNAPGDSAECPNCRRILFIPEQ